MKLSLCMIVKDEAEHLPECLKSVHELVDEVIVVDTGSEDNTPAIARSMGASVYPYQWRDDFAAARNESLEYASGDWILVLDADEVIDHEDHGHIRGLIESGTADGYRLVQRSYQSRSTQSDWTANENPTPFSRGYPGYIPSPLVRLFRNLEPVNFKGRVHELVEHDLLTHGYRIQDTEIPIHHYGKTTGDKRLQRKQELYRKIGENKIKEKPSDARAFYELGIQYLELNAPDKAETALEQARALAPSDVKTVFNYAVALAKTGKVEQAIESYQRTLSLDPEHGGTINNLALLLQDNQGSPDEIDDLYQKALRLNPSHHAVHYNYGLFLEKTGNGAKAADQYRYALMVDPDFHPARVRMEKLKEKEESMIDLNSAQIDVDETDMNLIRLGQTYLEKEHWMEALDAFSSALLNAPEDVDLRFTCGFILEKLDQKEAAFEQYEQIMATDPKHVDTLFRLTQETLNQELWEDCITLCQVLISEAPQHSEAHFTMARALYNRGDYDAALKHVETILRIDKDHTPALELKNSIERKATVSSDKVLAEAGGSKLRIVFLAGGIPFSGDTLEKKPLGGAETGLIHMARIMALLGHEVSVFSQQGRGEWNGVKYNEFTDYSADLNKKTADVVITARFFHPSEVSLPARLRLFWTGDAHDQPYVIPLKDAEIINSIDRIITISQWQTDNFIKALGIPRDKFYITRNGVFWDHFKNLPKSRNQKKLIYTSTPFRGLDVLLYLFPRIRERVPEAELDIYSSMAVYGMNRKEDQKQFGHLYRFAKQPGVRLFGNVIQSELAEALKGAGVFAYPNTFEETSCIAIMEAMAAGLPVVTSQLGALPETVAQGGILIPGDPASDAYHDRFIDTVCNLLTDNNRWRQLSREGREWIENNNRWDHIAKEWISVFTKLLEEKQAISSSNLAPLNTTKAIG